MEKRYVGTLNIKVPCPICKRESDNPDASTDGKNIFVECEWCGCEFKLNSRAS